MSLNADQQRVKDLVAAFNTPIVFHPGGWADSCPEWLKLRVIAERAEMVCNGGWDKATDAEVTCYLFTASLAAPLGGDWTEITLYQAAQQMPQLREALPGTPKELSNYQMMELVDLKHKIRNRQINGQKSNRKEKGMTKRKLVMEEQDGGTLVGVMQDGCDPIIKTTEGGLDEALAAVPGFLTEAQEKWAVQPKNPAYIPPVTPKPAAKPVAATTPAAPKVGELPLLAGTQTIPSPAPEPEAVTPEPEAVTPETQLTGDAGGYLPEPEAVTPGPEAVTTTKEGKAAQAEAVGLHIPDEGNLSAPAEGEITKTPAAPAAVEPETTAPPAKPGEWEYMLPDGRGPYDSVQLALDVLGLDKNSRPQHNRWDRLSTAYKEKIQRRPKA